MVIFRRKVDGWNPLSSSKKFKGRVQLKGKGWLSTTTTIKDHKSVNIVRWECSGQLFSLLFGLNCWAYEKRRDAGKLHIELNYQCEAPYETSDKIPPESPSLSLSFSHSQFSPLILFTILREMKIFQGISSMWMRNANSCLFPIFPTHSLPFIDKSSKRNLGTVKRAKRLNAHFISTKEFNQIEKKEHTQTERRKKVQLTFDVAHPLTAPVLEISLLSFIFIPRIYPLCFLLTILPSFFCKLWALHENITGLAI